MPLSYFDLLQPRDAQQAASQSFARQSAGRLAVLPPVSLTPALRAAGTRSLQGQRLALAERELAQQEDATDYTAGQRPFEIAAGLASGGLRLYGGYRALQEQDAAKALAQRQLAMQQRTQDLLRQQAAAQTAGLANIATIHNRFFPAPVAP